MGNLKDVDRNRVVECAKLYVRVFNGAPWNDAWTMETAFRRLTDIFDTPNFEGVLYEEEGEVKGAAFGYIEQFYDGRHYTLVEMFVDAECQGRGVGTAILRNLEEKVSMRGVTTVVLFTSKNNGTSRFYEGSGYEAWTSMVMMGKEI